MAIISSDSVSVVVQGPVENPSTGVVLRSIRQHFPNAEIVLSTWRDTDTAGLEYDVLRLNEDPGPIEGLKEVGRNPNANRMIASTSNGLSVATRDYVIKTRTDIIFRNANVLTWLDRYPKRSSKQNIFMERVVVSSFYSVNPRRGIEDRPYHLSDIFQFGRRQDLSKLWSVPQVADDWRTNSVEFCDPNENLDISKFSNEQFLWINFVRQYRKIQMRHPWDANTRHVKKFESFVANNLVIVDSDGIGIHHIKHRLRPLAMINAYTHGEWRDLYKKYSDPRHIKWMDFETTWRDLLMYFHNISGKRLIPIINSALRTTKQFLYSLVGISK